MESTFLGLEQLLRERESGEDSQLSVFSADRMLTPTLHLYDDMKVVYKNIHAVEKVKMELLHFPKY